MGAFFTNLHVRNRITKAICTALQKHGRAYASPVSGGWVSVYSEATESQNNETMRELASGLSRQLKTEVIGFSVHDSDIAIYWLFENGDLLDEFNSAPDYFSTDIEELTDAPLGGDVEKLLPICVPGTTRAQLKQFLHPVDGFPVMAEEIVGELAKLLGIDETRACFGFEYFEHEGAQVFANIAEFEPIGGAERLQPQITAVKAPEFRMPDTYPLAVGMLAQVWNPEYGLTEGDNEDPFLKQLRTQFDRTARDLLKKSELPDLPTLEELKSARDSGPEALSKLLAAKTPGQLPEIANNAIIAGLESFLVALLQYVDPTARDSAGRTLLELAAQVHGVDSPIYKDIKSSKNG